MSQSTTFKCTTQSFESRSGRFCSRSRAFHQKCSAVPSKSETLPGRKAAHAHRSAMEGFDGQDGWDSRHQETTTPKLPAEQCRRRQMLRSFLSAGCVGGSILADTRQSQAALLQFPATELKNDYYLVRAGEGQSEADGLVFTNPVYKTSMYSGLTPQARQQVAKELVPKLRSLGACTEGCWIWPSICQRSYQTAEIMATQLGLSRSRIVPEYSFLDARGLGDLEGMKVEAAAQRVADGDSSSPDWRPPKGSDGTPHESVADVLVRGRQVLSICETQFRNSEILIVSPDSDNLSILQAAILGVDLRQHSRYAFSPGEVRPVLLSTEPANYGNSKFACPNPPRCVS